MASVNWPHFKEWKVALNNIAMEFKYFKRNSTCLQHYLMNSAHLLIVKACLVSLLFNCAHYSALQFFAKWISCMNSPTCCSQIFFVISTASPFVLTRKAKKTAISCQRHYTGHHFPILRVLRAVHFNRRFLRERSYIQLETCWMYAEDLQQPKSTVT